MKKLSLLCALLFVIAGSPVSAVAPADPELTTDKKRYREKAPVTVTLKNQAEYELAFESPWKIKDSKGNTVSNMYWSQGESPLAQGESLSWVWDQTPNDCGSDGACTDVGGWVRPGTYTAIVETQDGTVQTQFQIGEYFTVGFESRPKLRFGVFVARRDDIDQMRAEAEAEDKTLIVSGKVRAWRADYNPDWRFVMDPKTIVLGEMFIEVCDGSPWYVQRNLDEWQGQRWCPWSSYVIKQGRP